ncbi:site-specific integrase [Demequina sp. NBRC 110054]|uniref:tyrosine-type recombinase/integrase n=1 Tax=Demequina sp. NBRC 110054 TaxID=1570343 RepID=UPI000A047715|nr:site-specific integrase [Demequina sp. NBRC 110054]
MSATQRRARRRSFGSVERLASGRFRARYTGPDGRSRSAPSTFATKSEADRWLTLIRAELLRGSWTAPEAANITLADYTTAWLRQRTPQLRPRTLDLYRRLVDRWLLAPVGEGRHAVSLGPLPLRALTPALVREWHAAVSEAAHASASARGVTETRRTHPARAWAHAAGLTVARTGRLSPAIVDAWHQAGAPRPAKPTRERPNAGCTIAAQAYRLLHAILTTATDDELLTANPARIAGAGHVAHPERLPLTPQEVTRLAAAMPEHYHAAVLVAAWSGLRPGEVFALRRRDLDLARGRLSVRQTLVEVAGHPVAYGPPKTAAGRRTVALPVIVTNALTEHLERHTNPGTDALVFTTTTGLPVTSATRSHAMRTARTAIGRPDITWHHLRHTGATLAAQAGATPAELMARIGHTSTRAAHIYQHATLDRDAHIAVALDALARR